MERMMGINGPSMDRYDMDFGPFEGSVWLNCAHQGPLPKAAVEQAHLALRQKITPHRLAYSLFEEVPLRLKRALASLIGCSSHEIILGNSTSYGLNLLVQGLALGEGDEILLVDGDFPASIITWLPLRDRGVNVRFLKPREWPPSPAAIQEALTERTRVFCSSWVFSFFGCAIDIESIGSICQEHDVMFVLNASQAIGTREIDMSRAPVDVLVSCGFKWLCGPYGTGFAWMKPEVSDALRYEQAYWLAHASPSAPVYELRDDLGSARYDIFCTANFLNYMTWTASIEYLLGKGIGRIQTHNDGLVEMVIDGLRSAGYSLISPPAGRFRSTLVLFSHPQAGRNRDIHEQLEREGVYIAERDDNLRISPHLYNTPAEIERVMKLLASVS